MSDTPLATRWRIVLGAWVLSESLAFGILWGAGWLRFTAEQILCTLVGPLASVTAIPRFQYHSLLANVSFVLAFAVLTVFPFLLVWRARRWTLAMSLLAWLVWPWLGFLLTIHHM